MPAVKMSASPGNLWIMNEAGQRTSEVWELIASIGGESFGRKWTQLTRRIFAIPLGELLQGESPDNHSEMDTRGPKKL